MCHEKVIPKVSVRSVMSLNAGQHALTTVRVDSELPEEYEINVEVLPKFVVTFSLCSCGKCHHRVCKR